MTRNIFQAQNPMTLNINWWLYVNLRRDRHITLSPYGIILRKYLTYLILLHKSIACGQCKVSCSRFTRSTESFDLYSVGTFIEILWDNNMLGLHTTSLRSVDDTIKETFGALMNFWSLKQYKNTFTNFFKKITSKVKGNLYK